MTLRALLAAIGGTAVAFAIAIAIAAGTPASAPSVATTTGAQRVELVRSQAAASTAAWNEDCVVAL